jgi:hypothetical protein
MNTEEAIARTEEMTGLVKKLKQINTPLGKSRFMDTTGNLLVYPSTICQLIPTGKIDDKAINRVGEDLAVLETYLGLIDKYKKFAPLESYERQDDEPSVFSQLRERAGADFKEKGYSSAIPYYVQLSKENLESR